MGYGLSLQSLGIPLDNTGASLWESNTYGSADYLEPITTHGLVIANNLHSSVSTAFAGASAIFNGTPDGTSGGVNFYGVLSYGSGFTAFGSLNVMGRAQGTASAPTYVPDTGYLGAYTFTGYDGSAWAAGGANHVYPGLVARAAADVSGSVLEADVWMGGLLTKMIGFESDTNAIKFNEAQLDSDMTFYYDAGTALTIDGATGAVVARTISSPDTGTTGAERFGAGATATGQNSTAIGSNATGTATNSVVIGRASTDGGFSGAVVLGFAASSTGQNSFSLGRGAVANAQSIAIGYNSSANFSTSIALGRTATTTTNKQFVAGADTYSIDNVFFGTGVLSAAPGSYTINGSGGSGTDIAGGNITIAGGKNTGAGAGGSIIFQTSPAGASSATLATLATRLTIDTTGLSTFDGDINFALGTARTVKPTDRTDGAGAGYALTVNGGSQTAGTGAGGALNLNGGAGFGVSAGGAVVITGGGSLTGGAVTINGGTGVATGATNIATTRGNLNLSRTGGAIGFFGATAVVQSTGWSATNVTTDKTFDANATTVNELADVLGTLIDTLKTYGIIGA